MKNVIFSGKRVVIPLLAMCLVIFSGCATVKVYSDAGLKNETGLRCYSLKPYLLVEYTADRDNAVKTTVVHLPDLANPQYMVLKAGLGSGELKMTFDGGALTSYGVATESQLPELLEAFASMLSKSAYAAETFSGPEAPGTINDERGTPFKLFEILPTPTGTVLKEVLP